MVEAALQPSSIYRCEDGFANVADSTKTLWYLLYQESRVAQPTFRQGNHQNVVMQMNLKVAGGDVRTCFDNRFTLSCESCRDAITIPKICPTDAMSEGNHKKYHWFNFMRNYSDHCKLNIFFCPRISKFLWCKIPQSMRHMHLETSQKEQSNNLSRQATSHADGSFQDSPMSDYRLDSSDVIPERGILAGYSENEVRIQKVYQLSIFSHLSNSSNSLEQKNCKRSIKRSVTELHPDLELNQKRIHLHCKNSAALTENLNASHCGVDNDSLSEKNIEKAGDCTDQQDVSFHDEEPIVHGSAQHFCHSGLHVIEHKDFQDSILIEDGETGTPRNKLVPTTPTSEKEVQPITSTGLLSSEKTPSSVGHSSAISVRCTAKRKLLSPTNALGKDLCSGDETPSVAKKCRIQLTNSIPVSCRSTDAKAAPFWNHLLPSSRDANKNSSDCISAARRLKNGLRLKSRHLRSALAGESNKFSSRNNTSFSVSRSLLGNFEESLLNGRFAPSGRIEGFTAELGASGSYCPQHVTLPVDVSYYNISEHSAPSPFLGVINLESLGKKGYNVPKAGTIQVTLFNPNKTVVKMFLVTYDFSDMPPNHITLLRHRIFLVPVEENEGTCENMENSEVKRKVLCYLIHLRFQSSKSGKIYLHSDIRLLFSRKSSEVDAGIPYELKSFTEMPRNPKYSPRV
ncbi:atos homolog protein B isoform X2 [Hemitrygon akajei]|uniref:atos homolog protein B isoform X2 n=1 Tax=Hemitrygon akajei TaxID=2704970 RepID=UPI003BF9CD2E